MATNAEVTKNDGENAVNLIRRFKARAGRGAYPAHAHPPLLTPASSRRDVRRKQTLKVIERREEVQELIKLGKMMERTTRGRRRK